MARNPKTRTVSPDDMIVLTAEEARRLERLERLARVLDNQFTLPGTRIGFGLDGVLGLIPGVGDTFTLLISSFLIREAHSIGAPLSLKLKMGRNVLIDWLTGLVPVAGDLFDFGWQANQRNVRLLREHLYQRGKIKPSPHQPGRQSHSSS
jgi:hypothetical protein